MKTKLYAHQMNTYLLSCFFVLLGFLAKQNASAQYCPLSGDCSDYITQMNVANFSKVQTVADCNSNSGYTYFSGDTIVFQAGQAYPINVYITQLGVEVSVFLDTNMNGSWESIDEETLLASPEVLTLRTGAMVISPNQRPGLSRMRVVVYLVLDAPADPCNMTAFHVVDVPVKFVGAGAQSTYCAAGGSNNCSSQVTSGTNTITKFDWISRFTVTGDNGGIDNRTTCDVYGDYTNLKTTFTGGDQYTATIERDSSGSALSQAAIYIDWNDDKDFDDPGENFSAPVSSLGPPLTHTCAIVAPANAVTGLKRMRVRTTLASNTPAPCGTQTNGEVEDYTVLYLNPITPAPLCTDKTKSYPKNDTINVCVGLDSLRWSKVAGVTGYKVTLLDSATGAIIKNKVTTTDSALSVFGSLSVGKTYKWIVEPYDANGSAIGCDTLKFRTSPNLDPKATLLPTKDTTLCQGEAIMFNGNPSLGTIPYSHDWTKSDANTLDTYATVNPNLLSTLPIGTYKIIYTVIDANGCKSGDTARVVINQNAVAGSLAAVPSFICEGESSNIILDGHVGQIQWESAPNATGPWTPVSLAAVNDSTANTGTLLTTTYFRAMVSLGTCSKTSNAITINVTPLPVKPNILSSGNTACEGDVVTLRVTNYSSDIFWDDENVTSNPELLVTKSGTYTATYGGACERKSDPVTVVFNPRPAKPVVTVQGNNPACSGDVVTLTSSVATGNIWSSGQTTNTITVTTSGVYTVEQKNSFDCKSTSDAVTVTINPKPTAPIITVVNSGTLCEGDLVKVTSNYTAGLTWNTGSTTDTITVSTSGTYSVIYTDANGCKSNSTSYVLTMNPLPAKPIVSVNGPLCVGSTGMLSSTETGFKTWNSGATGDQISITQPGVYFVTLVDGNGCSATSANFNATFDTPPNKPTITQTGNFLSADVQADSYQWYDNTGPIVGAIIKTYTPTHGGYHYVIALSPQGCESAPADSIFFSGVGIIKTSQVGNFVLYPNPTSGTFQLEVNALEVDSYQVLDLAGKMVVNGNLSSGKNSVTVHLAPGVYQIQVLKGPEIKGNQRLLIQ